MKRYCFPLQPLVVLRSHEERRASDAFAASLQAHAEAERALAAARARVAALSLSLTADRETPFSAHSAAAAMAEYRLECAKEAEAAAAVAQAAQQLLRRRGEYLTAHRNIEVLARLEREARRQHAAALAREEQAGYDERAARAVHHATDILP